MRRFASDRVTNITKLSCNGVLTCHSRTSYRCQSSGTLGCRCTCTWIFFHHNFQQRSSLLTCSHSLIALDFVGARTILRIVYKTKPIVVATSSVLTVTSGWRVSTATWIRTWRWRRCGSRRRFLIWGTQSVRLTTRHRGRAWTIVRIIYKTKSILVTATTILLITTGSAGSASARIWTWRWSRTWGWPLGCRTGGWALGCGARGWCTTSIRLSTRGLSSTGAIVRIIHKAKSLVCTSTTIVSVARGGGTATSTRIRSGSTRGPWCWALCCGSWRWSTGRGSWRWSAGGRAWR